jgi:hypothetical protein
VSASEAAVRAGRAAGGERYAATIAHRDGQWVVKASDLPFNVPADLRAAIKAAIEAAGFKYAGLCLEIDQSQYIGQRCAFVLSHSSVEALVKYGLVLSDEVHTLHLRRGTNAWSVVSNSGVPAPTATPTTRPPATNSPTPAAPVNTPVVPAPSNPSSPGTPVDPPAPTATNTPPATHTPPATPTSRPNTPVPTRTPVVIGTPIDSAVSPALGQAIQVYVEDKGFTFIGLCLGVERELLSYERCASGTMISTSEAMVSFGPVTQDPTEDLFVRNGEDWAPVGQTEDGNQLYLPFLILAIGLVLVGGLGVRHALGHS